MKGSRMREIRTAMGMPAKTFGDLLGCSEHSVYRLEWQDEVRCLTLQERILGLLDERLRHDPVALRAVADALKGAGGGLFALHTLLADEYAARAPGPRAVAT